MPEQNVGDSVTQYRNLLKMSLITICNTPFKFPDITSFKSYFVSTEVLHLFFCSDIVSNFY